jgi:hypothetical protein
MIWRRVLVNSDILLSDFHRVIQVSMGWEDCHLHQFIKGDKYYAVDMDDAFLPFDPERNINYEGMKISELLKTEKEKIEYEYDFGDGWEHEIVLEKVLPDDPSYKNPVCTDGQMSCPPEDCGGVWGYSNLLEILNNPEHKEFENYRDWFGSEFDPRNFDINKINRKLKKKNFGYN